MKNIIRAALYVRVSTDEQARDGYSLEAQKEHLIAYANKHKYKIVDVYLDDGYSARKSMMKRKELVRMIDDVKSNKIDLILFIKLDRWFRNISDYYKVQEILEQNNVNWKTTMEDYDTTTSNGRLNINIRLSVAQDEADKTSERIKFVFEKKINDGQVVSGSVPFGYEIKNKRLSIVEEKAEIVRMIYTMYDNMQSKHGLLKKLNDEMGYNFSYQFLKRLLNNEKYIGKSRDNHNFCKPIIDKELFYSVQEKQKQNYIRTPKKHSYIFRGILKCPYCGGNLCGSVSQGRYYYRCEKHYVQVRCPNNKSKSEIMIEKYMIDNVINELNKYELSLKAENKKIKDNQKKIKDKIKRLESKQKRLKDLYVNSFLSMKEFKSQYNQLEKEINNLSINNDFEKEQENLNYLIDLFNNDFYDAYHKLDNEHKNLFWRKAIKSIVPDKDYNSFSINFF